MKLITKEIERQLIKAWDEHQKATEDSGNPIPIGEQMVICKLFNPMGAGSWFLLELCQEDNVFFGFCHIHEGEWGYVSRQELEEYRGPGGLGIERDLYFKPCKVKDCKELEQYGYIPLED